MKPHLDAIDRFLKSLEAARDDDELRLLFGTYQAQYETDLPKDPDSPAYRDRQFELYQHLYGKPYSTDHEHTPFDVTTIARTPFPYSTGSWSTVGNQLIAIGYLIKAMALPKGARILEFGPGWGNTTIALGRMGYEVTAVDIEPNFVELIRVRAAAEGAPGVTVELGDFLSVQPGDRPYDAILFFECFHHCADHLQMIARFDRLLSKQGLICFAGEPITPDFPVPWGLRMDGESLWAIRKNGWLELGFNLDYFESAMARHGWRLSQRTSPESPWASVLIAHRSSEPVAQWSFRNGELHSIVGTVNNGAVHADGRAGYLMHGPYAAVGRGQYEMQFLVRGLEPKAGEIEVDVVSSKGQTVHAARKLDLSTEPAIPDIAFELLEPVTDLEIRVRTEANSRLALAGVRLLHQGSTQPHGAPPRRLRNLNARRWRRRIASGLQRLAGRIA